uniref:Uncharacterized protein n=1 Tax=Arundo donax TaxID=35708 RepID=A0A0A8ZUW1_ARUDO
MKHFYLTKPNPRKLLYE